LLSVRMELGGRPGSNRRRRGSQPRVLPLHHGHHESGDDRTRTGGLSPDKRVLCSSELRPRRVRGWDSNPRSRAHEAREDNRSSTAQSGWQESNLRSPAPEAGGVACSPTARSEQRAPPAGFEPAASGLRARRHRRFDHRGRLRRQGSNLPLAVNSRASFRLDHAGTISGRRGSRTPKAQSEPTRFRDGIPRRWQSFRRWPRQASNLQPSA
jgi:hypothetical protein